jgi:hypothetical protein
MDYETLSNCFLGVFEHYKKDEEYVFTMCKLRNDLVKFLAFVDSNRDNNEWHVSFNGLSFDAQITQYIMKERKLLLTLSGEEVARKIYAQAQATIERSREGEFPEYSENKLWIKQIDIFKLNHWDNPAKRSSLKWIQGSMRWSNVQDMPIEHTEEIHTVEQLKEIAMYCRNDVASTKKVMELSAKQISLRGKLTEQYGINLYNASEPKISKELFLYFLVKETGLKKYHLKKLRTFRSEIVIKDLILPYIKFTTPEFQDLQQHFEKLVLDPQNLKGQFKAHVQYRGLKTVFGLGGVHGAKRGIYVPDAHMTIMSSDVVSYYPNMAIRNKWSPAHLPKEIFCKLYEWFFVERRKIPKTNIQNYVYKIILNATYGLSNDVNSYLYDPEFTMRITINGQLSLMMLYEKLSEEIPGAMPIMQNTDGVEIMIPTKYIDKYLEVCKEWEDQTQLMLEHDQYQKMIVPDVNNYIAVLKYKEVDKDTFFKIMQSSPEYLFKKEEGKYYYAATKCKGRFQLDKELHKNSSFMAINKALYYFFVHGIAPEVSLEENKDIFDYCGLTRARGVWGFKEVHMKEGEVITTDLQKTLRYLVTNKGKKLVKHNKTDNRQAMVEAGKWMQTVFNTYEEKPFKEYDLDMAFYLKKINKEIQALQPELFAEQQQLFN